LFATFSNKNASGSQTAHYLRSRNRSIGALRDQSSNDEAFNWVPVMFEAIRNLSKLDVALIVIAVLVLIVGISCLM